jgi:WD40 repeat protein
MVNAEIYTVGGTVQTNEQGLYIPRAADGELLNLCQQGELAYVLTPRQMGKSSLMIRTAEQVIAAGGQAVIIDLGLIGTQVTAEQWYRGLLTPIADQLMLNVSLDDWWQKHDNLGLTQRLTLFFEQVVLAEVDGSLVVFVDEIDTTLSLDFTDDFFVAIRSLYVARANLPELRRLSFVLIGVAMPGDLIRDAQRTPFNIGQQVDLTDFTLNEALPLVAGFKLPEEDAAQTLEWVLEWTGGHPYLTQRLCRAIAQSEETDWSKTKIQQLVSSTFLGRQSVQDNNLQFVRDMLTVRAQTVGTEAVLKTYREILVGRRPVVDEEQSLVKSHLKLSGVVRREGIHLQVRNLIYTRVFNQAWIREHFPENFWQRYWPVLRWAVPLTAISVIVAVVMAGLLGEAERQRRIAERREQEARVLNWLSTTKAAEGMVLSIVTMAESKSYPTVEMTAQNSLLSSVQMSREVNRLQRHTNWVTSVAFNSDGKRIVSGSWDKTLRLWDAQTGEPIGQLLQGYKDDISSFAFSPDGKRIVIGGGGGTLQLWDIQTRQPIGQLLQGHTSYITSVAFNSDGTRIVSGSFDGTLRLWDAQTGELIGQPLQGYTNATRSSVAIRSVTFSSDGKRIVSGSEDNTLRLWDAYTGQLIGQPLRGHKEGVTSVAFSPNGKIIVSGSDDKTLRLWDAQTGQSIGQLRGHKFGVTSVAFSPDGKLIVSGSFDGTLQLWDAQTEEPVGQPLRGHTAALSSVAFSPDGKLIVSGSTDKTVRLWGAQTEKLIGQLLRGHKSRVTSIAFSPDSKRIVSGSEDNTLWLWDVNTGQPIGQPLQGHTKWVSSVTFSPDGKRIVSGSGDESLRLWDANTGQPIGQPLQGHTDSVSSVTFSPNGKRIVSSSRDKTLRAWDAQTGQPIGQPLKGYTAVTFSPDNKRIVSSSRDKTLRLWDAQTGQPIGQPLKGARAVAFSPDGKRIVSASDDTTLQLWNAQTGQPIGQPLPGHTDEVTSVAFSPDGKRIVSGSKDNTLRLWDANTGQPIGQPLQGHTNWVSSVAFSPDGKHIVSGSDDSTLRLWDVSPESWLAIACNRLQYHLLLNRPETIISDPEMIQVAKRARTVCKQRVWQ